MGKEEIKLSLLTYNMTDLIEIPKNLLKYLIGLKSKFSKAIGFKINIQISSAFFDELAVKILIEILKN